MQTQRTLRTLPAWRDNYVHLLDDGTHAVVVDPTDADVVLAALQQHQLTLAAVLLTHHHPDHVNGVEALTEATGCPVIGHEADRDRLPATQWTTPGSTLQVASFTFDVLDVHAHTRGHIAYLLRAPVDRVVRQAHDAAPQHAPALDGHGAVFCGDALFMAGCGRLFEGDGKDLYAVMQTLHGLDDVLVCCAHEYTAANLAFVVGALPDTVVGQAAAARLQEVQEGGAPTVPDLLARERQSNPFLRCADDAAVAEMAAALHMEGASGEAVVTALRRLKDG